jgi:hypothetical protein
MKAELKEQIRSQLTAQAEVMAEASGGGGIVIPKVRGRA